MRLASIELTRSVGWPPCHGDTYRTPHGGFLEWFALRASDEARNQSSSPLTTLIIIFHFSGATPVTRMIPLPCNIGLPPNTVLFKLLIPSTEEK